jgi:hypothetical protein
LPKDDPISRTDLLPSSLSNGIVILSAKYSKGFYELVYRPRLPKSFNLHSRHKLSRRQKSLVGASVAGCLIPPRWRSVVAASIR